MLLKSKDIALIGILMAIGVILVTLGGYFEGSTLFFLAAASFLAGIVQRNQSTIAAVAFLIGTTLLSLILAPQKLYCATFLAFGIYVILAEWLEKRFKGGKKKKTSVLWIAKAAVYHVLLLVTLYFAQRLFGWETLFQGRLLSALQEYQVLFWIAAVIFAEALWVIFDRAYFYFQNRYGGVILKILNRGHLD